jgi:hypothetical protein
MNNNIFSYIINQINMESNGLNFIVIFSITYLVFSYGYIQYYKIELNNIYSCQNIIPIIVLNMFSVLSYIIYSRNINDEEKANKLGGHFILMPMYLLMFYYGFVVLKLV